MTMRVMMCLVLLVVSTKGQAAGFHSADANQDYVLNLSELLHDVQIYNRGRYYPCDTEESGFCAGYRPVQLGNLVGRSLGTGQNCSESNPGLWCELRSAGLLINSGDITYVYSDTVAKGVVISSPQSGQTVFEGTRVSLTVSAGSAPSIPDVVGMSEGDALMEFVALGITLCSSRPWPTETSETVPVGMVFGTSVAIGSKHISPDSCVGLVISSGPAPSEGEDCPQGFFQIVAEYPEDTVFSLGDSQEYYPVFCGSEPVKVTFLGYRSDGIQFVWTPGATALVTLQGKPGWSAFLDPLDSHRAIVTHELGSLEQGATDEWFASIEDSPESEISGEFPFDVE